MKYLNLRLAGILAIFLAMSITTVQADSAYRQQGYEFSFQSQYVYGETIKYDGGAQAEVQSDVGFGFGLAYNYSNQFAFRGDFSWNSANYEALRILDGGNPSETYGGLLETVSLMFGGDYYLLDKAITPYVGANLGWTFYDTNIPSGKPSSTCWYDPWYGYICSTSTPTVSETEFSYGLGLGVRAELGTNMFVRLGYYDRWTDFAKARDTTKFGAVRMDIGMKFY